MYKMGIQDEITEKIQVVCKTYKLPLAQFWIQFSSDGSDKRNGLKCSSKPRSIYLDVDLVKYQRLVKFNGICIRCSTLGVGQGVVGNALLYHKPFFCRDVSQLSTTEYPLSCHARNYGLASCLAICLDTSTNSSGRTCTKTPEYVLEFFLPQSVKTISGEQLQTLLESIFATVKEHFKIYLGPGKELCEVMNIPINEKEPGSFHIRLHPGIRPTSGSSSHEIEKVNQSPVRGTGVNTGFDVCLLDKLTEASERNSGKTSSKKDERTSRLSSPTAESLEDDIRSISLLDDKADKVAHRKDKTSAAEKSEPFTACSSTSQRISCRAVISKRKDYTATNDFSSGAQSSNERCNIHPSSLPQAQREVNSSSTSMTKHVNEVDRKKMKLDSSFSTCKQQPNLFSTCNQQPNSFSTCNQQPNGSPLGQNVDNVTIKAKHGDDIIRVDIPFSSTTADLRQSLTMRWKFIDESFKIKYLDEENDWVLISCDEDLQQCFSISRSLEKSNIKMLVNKEKEKENPIKQKI